MIGMIGIFGWLTIYIYINTYIMVSWWLLHIVTFLPFYGDILKTHWNIEPNNVSQKWGIWFQHGNLSVLSMMIHQWIQHYNFQTNPTWGPEKLDWTELSMQCMKPERIGLLDWLAVLYPMWTFLSTIENIPIVLGWLLDQIGRVSNR